ncbi:DegT/DnrJ/EryC1/StrS family aminotransferase [Streptomyces erythrochromogenes]|uniref:DegT/DnrJ/EryC1/StrS family aminotransferase n=1 Tax=Streptomyces erythrochromogenes TaxID=285574 RepID=UPI0002DD26BF
MPQQPAPVYQYSQLTADAQNTLVGGGILTGQIATFNGELIPDLEDRVAGLTGRAQGLAVDSGSSALRMAMRGLEIRADQEVIIPEIGWVSIGAAADMLGATVRVAPATESLTPTWTEIAALIGPDTAAVVLVHLRGRPAPGTAEIAHHLTELGIPLIEDCAQAWGVDVEGRPAGGWGTLATFSTHSMKLIATGEGGLVVGDDPDMMALMRAIAGDTRQRTPRAVWRSKARMTELAAGLALPQLEHLPVLVENLRALQGEVHLQLAALKGLQLVPGSTEPAGNGSLVGVRVADAATASRISGALFHHGYLSWWPGPGDLHTAEAWPVQPARQLTDHRTYFDIQIPWLPADAHKQWACTLADVVQQGLESGR